MAVDLAIEETEGFGYEKFNERMKKFQIEARELFREFDKTYSD